MKTGTKLVLILGGTVLLLGFVAIFAIVGFTLLGMNSGTQRARETFKKQSAETVGTITNVKLNTSTKEYTYQYVVNGVSYSATYLGGRSAVEKNYQDRVGVKGRVCYDPSDPNSSSFTFSDVYNAKGEKIVCGGTSP